MSAGPRGFHVWANDIRLHYLQYAEDETAPPLVILPGITSPAVTWGFVAQRLAATHCVYVLDNRGRGLSERAPGMGHRIADYARDTEAVIDALGFERIQLMGHSLGGRIAARTAAEAPQMIERLILVDPPMTGPGLPPAAQPVEYYTGLIDETLAGGGIDTIRSTNPNWDIEHVILRAEWLPTCDKEAVAESYHAVHADAFGPDLERIACPTLLVYAGKVNVVRDEDADDIVRLTRSARAVRIDHVGHMIPWDDVEAFLSAIEDFIAEKS